MLKYYALILFIVIAAHAPVFAQTPADREIFIQAENLFREKKYDEALAAFRRSVQLDASNPAAHANIGMILVIQKKNTEAVAGFREAVRLAPTESLFQTLLCGGLAELKKYDEALASCANAVRLKPDAPDAYITSIEVMKAARRPTSEIFAAAVAAAQKFSDNEPLSFAAAELYLLNDDAAAAITIFEKLIRQNPQSVVYRLKAAKAYLQAERDTEAMAAARKVSELEPQNAPAHFLAGKIYLEIGQNEEAATEFQKTAELDKNFAPAFYFLGEAQTRRGKNSDAIAAFERAVVLAPADAEYHRQLGSALNTEGKYEKAVVSLVKADRLKPDDFEIKSALGVAFGEAGRYEEALQTLTEADRLQPGNQIIAMLMNVDRARRQNVPQIPAMTAYAAENPGDLNVRLHLIQLLTYSRKLTEAEPYFAEILKMSPSDIRVYEMIGTLRSTTGEYEKAAEAYHRAIEIGQSPSAYLGLTTVYARAGRIDDAMRAFEKVLEIKPDSPNIMKLYADLLRDNGKRREALAMYQRSLAMLPTNAPALFNAGILSAKLGDASAARQYQETLRTIDPKMGKILGRFIKFKG